MSDTTATVTVSEAAEKIVEKMKEKRAKVAAAPKAEEAIPEAGIEPITEIKGKGGRPKGSKNSAKKKTYTKVQKFDSTKQARAYTVAAQEILGTLSRFTTEEAIQILATVRTAGNIFLWGYGIMEASAAPTVPYPAPMEEVTIKVSNEGAAPAILGE